MAEHSGIPSPHLFELWSVSCFVLHRQRPASPRRDEPQDPSREAGANGYRRTGPLSVVRRDGLLFVRSMNSARPGPIATEQEGPGRPGPTRTPQLERVSDERIARARVVSEAEPAREPPEQVSECKSESAGHAVHRHRQCLLVSSDPALAPSLPGPRPERPIQDCGGEGAASYCLR